MIMRFLLLFMPREWLRRIFPMAMFRHEWEKLLKGPGDKGSCVPIMVGLAPTQRRFKINNFVGSPAVIANKLMTPAVKRIDCKVTEVAGEWDVTVYYGPDEEFESYVERLKNGDCDE